MGLTMVEALIRLKWISYLGSAFEAFLRMWLYGHRLAQDLITCIFIFACLSLICAFDFFRSQCFGCSLHHILVFRDPGQATRRADEEVRRSRSNVASQCASWSSSQEPAADSFGIRVQQEALLHLPPPPDRAPSSSRMANPNAPGAARS